MASYRLLPVEDSDYNAPIIVSTEPLVYFTWSSSALTIHSNRRHATVSLVPHIHDVIGIDEGRVLMVWSSGESAGITMVDSDGRVLGEFPLSGDQVNLQVVFFKWGDQTSPTGGWVDGSRTSLRSVRLGYCKGLIFWIDYNGGVYEVTLSEGRADLTHLGFIQGGGSKMIATGRDVSRWEPAVEGHHLGYQPGWGMLYLSWRMEAPDVEILDDSLRSVWLQGSGGGQQRLWSLALHKDVLICRASILKDGRLILRAELPTPVMCDLPDDDTGAIVQFEDTRYITEYRLYDAPTWSPADHQLLPPQHRAIVRTLFMLWRTNPTRTLPREIITLIAWLLPVQFDLL